MLKVCPESLIQDTYFLPKPPQTLADSHSEWLCRKCEGGPFILASTGVPRQNGTPESATDLFNSAEALARVDGDAELMANLIEIFFVESGPMMEAIRAAVASRDTGKLEKSAHRLKGSVSVFGARTVSATAFELEKMGRGGDLTNVAEFLEQLEQQITSLQPALRQFHRELQPSS